LIQFIPRELKSIGLGLLIGAIVAAVIGDYLVSQASAEKSRRAEERLVTMSAMALADLVEAEMQSEVERTNDVYQNLLVSFQERVSDVEAARIYWASKRRILATTFEEDLEFGEAPRRLSRDEKEIFDLGKSLAAALKTNIQEGGNRKSLLEGARNSEGQHVVTVPFFERSENGDQNIIGTITLRSAPTVPSGEVGLVPMLLLCIGPFLVYFIIIQLLWRRKPSPDDVNQLKLFPYLTLAFGILLAGLVIFNSYSLIHIASLNESTELSLSKQYVDLQGKVLESARQYAVPYEVEYANTWDVDRFLNPRNMFAFDGDLLIKVREMQNQQSRSLSLTFLFSGILSFVLMFFWGLGTARKLRDTVIENREAYLYVAPAMIGMLVLVFFPFMYGIGLSFTNQNLFNINEGYVENWNGVDNYVEILGDFNIFSVQKTESDEASLGVEGIEEAAADEGEGAVEAEKEVIINYGNFYWTLFITVMWTVFNVAIGVSVGLMLALILNTKGLRGKAVYRGLLILPWAIPNYVTALIWKGLFHQQFGPINQVLQMFGLPPVNWFDSVFTSFMTGIIVNGWLSFPFMMVICLGALQSISEDMYEAAHLDGASRFQQFIYITLPSLKPTLIPAVILSVVWTFNMFNVIYLVSGGEPGGANEILITQAYKIAFEKYQYGYSAAYSTVIFIILLVYSVFQNKMTKAVED
jgi:arabinogalactan oligomer/maltooligosaccharide transport system permease protein